MAMLSERDKSLLQDEIDKLISNTKSLQESIDSDFLEINNLMLTDISSKKFVDEKHLQIYELEEELRLCTGKTVIGAVEEDAFEISTNEPNVKVFVTDGRFIAKKNDISIVDVPIIDSRAYILSSVAGPNFDIWTRDRYGSATSQFNVPDSYIIHEGNNKIKIVIDGIEKTIQIISPDILEVSNGSLTVDASILASNLSLSLNENFENARCYYHTINKCFTIVSGSIGPNSTVQILVGIDSDDIARQMKFSTQVNIPGRYANNKLTVVIDKLEKEIEITFDMRIPITSSLGQVIDDYSADWKTNFDGPMFPAETNNGKKVATLIQTKLREIGEGGFKTAECMYFSSSNKFLISSGTFGETSSIEVKPNSDSNRDLAPFLGLLQPTDVKNNEKSYNTLQELYNYLNSKTVISCTNLQNPHFKCYSLLTIENGVLLSNIPYVLQTTSEYDKASILEPRLYSGKLKIDSSNDKIDTSEGTRTLQHGSFSEGELCEIIQSALNVGTTLFTVSYKKNTKNFEITASASVTLLFNTGNNKSKSIATYIGFLNTSDLIGTTFTGGPISFSGIDFFSMAEIPQLVPMTYFGNKPPYYFDSAVKSERDLLNAELILLNTEDNSGGLINNIKTQTDIYNESNIIALENVLTEELTFINSLMIAIQKLMSNYSIISTTDSIYTNLVTAYNNAETAKNKINACIASHNYLLNLRSSSKTFIFGTEFTTGGEESLNISFPQSNGDRLYNLTPIEFKYADNKYIPMKNLDTIYDNNSSFKMFLQQAFKIKSNVSAISGYSMSATDANGLFNITSIKSKVNVTIDGDAKIISLNLGTNLNGQSVSNDIQSKLQIIGTGGFTNAKCYWNRFDCVNRFKIVSGTTGLSSTVEISDEVIEVNALNNKFYFEDSHTQVTNQSIGTGNGTTAAYSGTLNPRIIPSSVSISATVDGVVRTVTDNGSGILSGYVTGSSNVINYLTGSYTFTFAGNVDISSTITITYKYYTLKLATIANGLYNGLGFATAVQNSLNATSSGYTCTYSAITNKLTLTSTQPYFNLRFNTDPSTATIILGFNNQDKIGSLSYVSDNDIVLSAVAELNYSTPTNDTGHVITDTKITITDTFISSKVYWSTGNIEHFHYDFSVYSNIKSLIDVIKNDFTTEYDISIGKATLWSRKKEKFQINNGEQFQIRVNNGSIQSVNFNLSRAQLSSGSNAQVVAVSGDTLTLSLNGEISRTITFPTPTSTGLETAAMIQSLVRSLIASNSENQLAYSNFICTYSSNYILTNGIYGSGSFINISGGTLSSKLSLTGSSNGSGPISNNMAVTAAQLVAVLVFPGVTISSDELFLKIQANNADEKLEIISNSLSNRIGFYNENLISEPSNEYTTVNCNSLINITDETISSDFIVNKGYENRGNITAIFYITDNIRLNSRLTDIIERKNYLSTRQSQITSRLSAINSVLSITNYSNRWIEVMKRLNKKTGSYFKVGDKQLAILRTQQSIIENNNKIAELKAMLGV
jgi:hypothetical protein